MPRKLTGEDRAVWEQVARQVSPLDAGARRRADLMTTTRPAPPTGPADPQSQGSDQGAKDGAADIRDLRIGSQAPARAPAHDPTADPATGRIATPPMPDRKTARGFRRGRLLPEARLDLHGMTLAEAHPALVRFIHRAQADGMRLVLVITGKGRERADDDPVPSRRGILRQQVPHWLQSGLLRRAVLQISDAHRRHGGDGAFYVWLRRNR